MGNAGDARHPQQLGGGEIGDVGGQLALGQRRQQVGVVHKLAPGKVQKAQPRLAGAEHAGVHKALGLGIGRQVQGDVVALSHQFGEAHAVMDGAAQVPGRLHRDVGVVAKDLHAQVHRRVGHLHADGAKTHHAQLFARKLRAHELALALFHQGGHRVALTGQALGPLHGGQQVAAGQQQAADGQFRHAAGVGAGGVEHHHARFAAFFHRDVVHARAGTADGQQALGQGHVVHFRAAHQNALGRVAVVVQFELGGAQFGQPRRGDVIQCFDGIHKALHSFFSRTVSQSPP